MPRLGRGRVEGGAAYRSKVATDVPVQAPVGGWNTRDAFDDVPPEDALVMDNWLPTFGAVAVRGGRTYHLTSSSVAEGGALNLNGDFELDFTDWFTQGDATIVTSPVHSPTKAARLETVISVPSFCEQSVSGLSVDTSYVLEVWIYGDGGSDAVFPSLEISLAASGAVIYYTAPSNAAEWRKYSIPFKTPLLGAGTNIKFFSPGSATRFCIYDDIFVYVAHTGTNVETLAVYEAENYNQLISADGGSIFNASNQGLPVVVGTGFSSDRWDTTNFDKLLILVNGVDVPQEYNGVSVQPLDPVLTGPVSTNVVGCTPFKNRMYYWEENSQSFWYTELFAKSGTCTEFPLAHLTKRGGTLIQIETWTKDGGSGPDDHIAFIMSSGEVIVFQGSSPASLSNWALVGVYYVGTILGNRAVTKYGGDLIIMTELDIVSMSQIIAGPEALAQRSKIVGALEQVAEFAGSNFFDAIMFPKKKIGLFNVPAPGPDSSYQFAQNLVTGAWSRLLDWTLYSWVVYNGDLYIGGNNGTVYQAFDGFVDATFDGEELTTAPIQSSLQTAWLDFGDPMEKSFHAVKPYIKAAGVQPYTIETAVDYGNMQTSSFPAEGTSGGTPWGSPWGSPWGATESVYQDWQITTGYGRVVSMMTRMTSKARVLWARTMWHIEGAVAM